MDIVVEIQIAELSVSIALKVLSRMKMVGICCNFSAYTRLYLGKHNENDCIIKYLIFQAHYVLLTSASSTSIGVGTVLGPARDPSLIFTFTGSAALLVLAAAAARDPSFIFTLTEFPASLACERTL